MINASWILAVLLFVAQTTNAHNKVGNGGGGLKIADGVYSLFGFGEKELHIESHVSLSDDFEYCDGLLFSSLKSDLRRLAQIMPRDASAFFRKELCPEGNTRYVQITATEANFHIFSSRTERLKKVYSSATGIPYKIITIFALSDPTKKKTYIFPEFFNLSLVEKKVIIFHELFWLYKFPVGMNQMPQSEELKLYRSMLELEKYLLEYLLQPKNYSAQLSFVEAFRNFIEE